MSDDCVAPFDEELSRAIRAGLSALGVRRFVLAIHDASFPSAPDEDLGRGSPYGKGGRALFAFAAAMGIDGVQLGPQGDTTLDNPSPYDGALFTKSPLSIALITLAEDPEWAPLCAGLLATEQRAIDMREARVGGGDNRTRYRAAWRAARRILRALHDRFVGEPEHRPLLRQRFAEFCHRRAATLEADGTFEALWFRYGTDDWRTWTGDTLGGGSLDRDLPLASPARTASAARGLASVREAGATQVLRHAFGQFVLEEQHRRLRRELMGHHPVALFGDLPIGFSHRDVWSLRALFRSDYLMGAPPSRTNPAGQPWGFPVLDPDQYFSDPVTRTPGPVLELLLARMDLLLHDFDGVRVDHPHGLVCPWVYAAADPDPAAAVARGARLFCSPRVSDHPALGRLAIPEPDQISVDPGIARYADDWVLALRDDQVARYGALFDALMVRVEAAGRSAADVVCEVLSTWPYPLRRVMERYDLGRFRVLQKAVLTRPDDAYRAENAAPRDWIMVGNHDTAPIWLLASAWHGTAVGRQWAAYLAERLFVGETQRAGFARWVAADPRHLCQAMFAVAFSSPARQVSVFFADFFGLREIYNRPGVVDGDNWMLRLTPTWRADYRARVRELAALNVPLALALALVGRSAHRGDGGPPRGTIDLLMRSARALTPTLDEDLLALLSDQP